VIPLTTPDDEDPAVRFGLTLLASISLNLHGLKLEGDLDYPCTAANFTRLRDDIEAALLTGAPLDQSKEDAEAGLLSLIATRRHLDEIQRGETPPLSGPPDLVAALTPEGIEEAIRHTLNVLDTGPLVAQLQA
jgi:hypothetical protein